MQHVIGVSSPSFAKSPILMEELAQLGCPVVANTKGTELNEKELIAFLAESRTDIAIVGREVVSEKVLSHAKHLKFIAKYGVGLDNLEPALLAAKGIGLGWTAGVNRRAVVELVLAYILGHVRNVVISHDRLRQGQWVKDGGRGLSELTFGIIGYGCVGSDLAKVLKTFGGRVMYTDIIDKSPEAQDSGAIYAPLDEIFKACDVITLHVPLTPETRGMIGSGELGRMKSSALLINTSRGAVVDFAAACQAVSAGLLGGFAADVFPEEPMDLRAWVHPQLYFTPHIAGNSTEAVLAMGRSAIGHVRSFLASPAPA